MSKDPALSFHPEAGDIPAHVLVNALRVGHNLRLDRGPYRVQGRVDLSGETITRPVVLNEVDFLDEVVFAATIFDRPVEFVSCQFLRGLRLENARFGASLSLRSSVVTGPAEWSGLHVENEFEGTLLCIHGSLQLNHARIGRDLRLDGARIEGPLHAHQSDIHGSWWIEPFFAPKLLEPVHPRIVGAFSLQGAVVGGALNCRGCEIAGGLRADFIRVTGDLTVAVWKHDGPGAKLRRHTRLGTEKGKSLVLTGATIGGGVRAEGIASDGCIMLQNASITGDVFVRNWSEEGGQAYRATVGAAEGHASLNFFGARIDGTVDLSGSLFQGWLNFTNVEIGEDLALRVWRASGHDSCTVIGRESTTNGEGVSLVITGARIAGDIDFRGLQAAGALRMATTQVEGHVLGQLWSPATQEDDETPRKVSLDHRTRIGADTDGIALELVGIHIQGRVDLRGGLYEGRVLLDHARVDRTVRFDAFKCRVDACETQVPVQITARSKAGLSLAMRGAHAASLELCLAQFAGGAAFDGTEIHGKVDFKLAQLAGELSFRGCNIRGSVTGAGAKAVAFAATDAQIVGDLLLPAATITDSLDLRGVTIRGGFQTESSLPKRCPVPVTIGGDAIFSYAHIGSAWIAFKVLDLPAAPSPAVRATAIDSSALPHSDAPPPPRTAPARCLLDHARVGTLQLQGDLKGYEPRIFNLTGTQFDDLKVDELTDTACPLRERPLHEHALAALARLVRHHPKDDGSASESHIYWHRYKIDIPQALVLPLMEDYDLEFSTRLEHWMRSRGDNTAADRFFLESKRAEHRQMRFLKSREYVYSRLTALQTRRHLLDEKRRARQSESPDPPPSTDLDDKLKPVLAELSYLEKFDEDSPHPPVVFRVEDYNRIPWHTRHAIQFRLLLDPTWLRNRILYKTIGFGVRLWPALVTWCLLLIATLLVFASPDSVDHPVTYVAVPVAIRHDPSSPAPLSPPPVASVWINPSSGPGLDWSWTDAAWIALRHQIPLVQIVSHNDWAPSPNPMWSYPAFPENSWLRHLNWLRRGPHYDSVASLLTIINTVLLSLILLGVTGLLKKRDA